MENSQINIVQVITQTINNLLSNHNYYFEIVTYVKLGSKTHELTTLFNVKDFTTLKVDAIVQIVNKFTTENLIDFDVRIEDPDGAISSDKVYLEARDRTGNLVYVDELRINYEYQRITIDKLDANAVVNYIDLIIGQYNVIKNSEIRDVKIKHMLTKLQDEFKHYISDN